MQTAQAATAQVAALSLDTSNVEMLAATAHAEATQAVWDLHRPVVDMQNRQVISCICVMF